MINLLGWSGDFAAHLFVKADPPVKKKGASMSDREENGQVIPC
jgi:hypothetical protein